jgi:glucokinase
LGRQVVPTRPADGAATALKRGLVAGQALLVEAGEGLELVGVGISTIGVPRDGGVDLAPAIPGWDAVELARGADQAFEVPVLAANDVKAAAMAEAEWGALRGPGPGIYLNLGTGLATALVVDGRVIDGAHGAAGEIGYNLLDRAGLGRSLDQRPMLEDVVSGMGVAAAARALGFAATCEEIFARAAYDDRSQAIVDALLDELCFHLVNLAVAFDPSTVAVAGGMTGSWATFQPRLEGALASGVPFPPDLVVASWPFDAPLVGAVALGVRAGGAPLQSAPRLGTTFSHNREMAERK